MTKTELVWLAGLLEGEGSFMTGPPSRPNKPIIQVQMCDEDIVARIAAMFGVRYHKHRPRDPKYKDTYSTAVRGRPAVAWMRQLLPHMGLRRQGQIRVALDGYRYDPMHWSRRPRVSQAQVRRLYAKGLTQREVATRLHCSHVTVGNYLRNSPSR